MRGAHQPETATARRACLGRRVTTSSTSHRDGVASNTKRPREPQPGAFSWGDTYGSSTAQLASRPAKPAFGHHSLSSDQRQKARAYDRAVETGRHRFARGFAAMVPLWIGVAPFGLAYAVVARDAGLSVLETQALSLLVFAGSAQFSAVGLVARGAGGLEIVLTTFLLNVRHVLYGLSLVRTTRIDGWRRPVAAFFLTDEAFGVAAAQRDRSFGFLLGTELSLFATWNLATLLGALLGSAIPDPAELGVDVVFPLAFLALLVPLLRTRVELIVAAAAGAAAWLTSRELPGGTPVLVAGVGGSLLGAWLTRREPADTELRLDDAAREPA